MRLAAATAIALVVAVAVNLAIEAFARKAFAVASEFEPFQGTVAPYTAGGVALAGVVYALVRHFVRDADPAFVRLSIAALVLSWIPDIALLVINEPGATVPAVGALMVMHGVAAVIAVTLLVRVAGGTRVSA